MLEQFLLVAFQSTHKAIKAETITTKAGLAARLIPVPPEVSAGCGLSLRVAEADGEKAREILKEAEIEGEYYLLTKEGRNRSVERL